MHAIIKVRIKNMKECTTIKSSENLLLLKLECVNMRKNNISYLP